MARKFKQRYKVYLLIFVIILAIFLGLGGLVLTKNINAQKGPLTILSEKEEHYTDGNDILLVMPKTNKKDVNKLLLVYRDNLLDKISEDYQNESLSLQVKVESNFDDNIFSLASYRIRKDQDNYEIIDIVDQRVIDLKGQELKIDDIFAEEYLSDLSMLVRASLAEDEALAFHEDTYKKILPKYESFKNFAIEGNDLVFTYRKNFFKDRPITRAKINNDQFRDYITASVLDYFNKDYEQKEAVKLRYIDPYQPMVALTFDDGPFLPTTKVISDTFAQYDQRVTFFTLGTRVNENADFVQEIASLGHEIANHSLDHPNLTTLSGTEIKKQTVNTAEKIKEITGQKLVTLRPPYGSYNDHVQREAEAPLIMWNVDTLDWKTRDLAQNKAALGKYLQDGNIILMHDIYEPSARAAADFIKEYQGDVQFVTVTELMAYKGIPLEDGNVYFSAN